MKKEFKSTPEASTLSAFNILVMATMSAGKSSLINALIGQELLHAANEATTACHTKITHELGKRTLTGSCQSPSGEISHCKNVDIETIRNWNASELVEKINLNGHLNVCPELSYGLILHDTPGPNNSQDNQHTKIAFEALRKTPFKLLLYVLNAAHLGTTDDRSLLLQLREETALNNDFTICFVLNKVDTLDEERGEQLSKHVAQAERYLTEIGFENPLIIPTMANVALYASKALKPEPLTRTQRTKLRQALEGPSFSKTALLDAALIPSIFKNKIHKELESLQQQAEQLDLLGEQINAIQQLRIASGLRTVEAIIESTQQKNLLQKLATTVLKSLAKPDNEEKKSNQPFDKESELLSPAKINFEGHVSTIGGFIADVMKTPNSSELSRSFLTIFRN